MAWETVKGQDRILQMLQHAIQGGRTPQALLLTGDDGAGTLAIALAFARAVNSVNDRAAKQAESLQHPNISIVVALPAGKAGVESELGADVIEELTELRRQAAVDPYLEFRLQNATQIRISQIRELKRQLAMSSVQEGRRVVIIHHAEDMTTEAANAFLKTLEEPHDDVTLILTAPTARRLLQTIVSRCQELPIPPLDDEEVVDFLVARNECSREEAQLIAPFAEGSIARARAFLAEDVRADREEAVDLLRSALKGRGFRIELSEAVGKVSEGRDRNRAVMILSLLALWIRDARSLAIVGSEASIANMDQREALERFVERFALADMDQVLTVIEAAVRDIRRNVTITTVILTTMLQIRAIFRQAPLPSKDDTSVQTKDTSA